MKKVLQICPNFSFKLTYFLKYELYKSNSYLHWSVKKVQNKIIFIVLSLKYQTPVPFVRITKSVQFVLFLS